MSDYSLYYFGFSTAAAKDANNAAIAQLSGNPADSRTFSIPCSVTGTGTPTHYATNCPATADDVDTLKAAMTAGTLTGITFYLVQRQPTGAFAGPLVGTNTPATPGQVMDWQGALTDAGLKVIEPPSPLAGGTP